MTLITLLLIPLLASGLSFVVPGRRWLELVTVIGTAAILILAGLAANQAMLFGHISDSAPTASHPGQQFVAWSPTNKLATLDKDDDTTLVIWQAY